MKNRELLQRAQQELGGRIATYDGSLVLHLAEKNEYGQADNLYLSPVEAGRRAGLDVVQFTTDLDEALMLSRPEPGAETKTWYYCSDVFGSEPALVSDVAEFQANLRDIYDDPSIALRWGIDGDAEYYYVETDGQREIVLREVRLNEDGDLVQVEDGQVIMPANQETILSDLAMITGLNHDQLRRACGDGRLQARQLYKSGPWLSTIANVEAALEAGTLQRRVGRPSLQ